MVDLESGIPSVLVPAYLMQVVWLRPLPLFDDLDANQLQSWLRANQHSLQQTLGHQKHQQLLDDVDSGYELSQSSGMAGGRRSLATL